MIHTSNEDQNPNEVAAPPQPDIVTETQEIGAESAQKVEHLLQEAKDYSERGQWIEALQKLDEVEQRSPQVPESVDRLKALKRKIAVWQKIERISDEAFELWQPYRESDALRKHAEVLKAALDPATGLQSRVRSYLIELQSRSDFHNDDVFRHAQELEASLLDELIDDPMARLYLIPSLNKWLHLNRKNSARGVISSLIELGRLEEAYELATRLLREYITDQALMEFAGRARTDLHSRLIQSVHNRLDRAQELTERGAVREALSALEEIDDRLVGPISLRYPEIVEGDSEFDYLLGQAAELHSHLERLLPVIMEVESLAEHARESVYQKNYAAALSFTHQAQRADPEHRAQLAWEQLDHIHGIALEFRARDLLQQAERGNYTEELDHDLRSFLEDARLFGLTDVEASKLLRHCDEVVASGRAFVEAVKVARYATDQQRFHEAREALKRARPIRPHDSLLLDLETALALNWANSMMAAYDKELANSRPSRDSVLTLQAETRELWPFFERALAFSILMQLRTLAKELEAKYIRLQIQEGYRALQSFVLEAASAICLEITERSESLGDFALVREARQLCDEVDLAVKGQEAAARQSQLLKFFSVVGFEIQDVWEGGALLLPREASLRTRLGPSIVAHVRLNVQANRRLLTELVEETTTRYEQAVTDRVTFMVVEQQPDFAALSFMQSYRFAERLTIIPFSASQMREALQRGVCGAVLNDVINTYLGRTDLYATSNPVSDVLSFFGRERVIDLISSALRKEANIGLFGMRKIGKTSLVKYMATQVPYPVAWLSLYESSTPLQVFYQAIRGWKQAMRLRFPQWVLSDLQTARSNADNHLAEAFTEDVQALVDALAQLGATPRLILCLDEIDKIGPRTTATEEHARRFTDLMGFLQALSTRVKSLNFIICGEQPTVNRAHFLEGPGFRIQNPLFQGLHEIFLGPFSQEETDEMVAKIGALMGVEFDPLSLKAVYDWSGGHPFLARQICSHAIRQVNARPVRITAAQVTEASEQFLRSSPYLEQELWRQLTTAGQADILRHLAEHGPSSESDLIPQALSPGDPWLRQQALAYLEERHLIRRDRTVFVIPYGCFREWIRREGGET